MKSQNSPLKVLIWNRTNDSFELTNPTTSAITCIGFRSPGQKRCSNKIAGRHISIAQSINKSFLKPNPPINSIPHMLLELAKATLCQHCHQDQAQELSER
jgi:hypothetical protein